MKHRQSWVVQGLLFLHSASVWAGSPSGLHSFTFESEHDFPVRMIRPLEVSHVKGNITIHGWSLDKVRVKVKKVVLAQNVQEAALLEKGVHFRYSVHPKSIELGTQYGKELSIEQRFREREAPRISLEMEVYAPTSLNLKVLAVGGQTRLKNWSASAEIRSHTGSIEVMNMRGDRLSTLCESCQTQIQSVRSQKVRVISREGGIVLQQVQAQDLYGETDQGKIQLFDIKGHQLYVTKSGPIEGQSLEGKVEFQGTSGGVILKDVSGFLSGSLDSGSLNAQVREWKFMDKGVLESRTGDLELRLPVGFSGELDVWSVQGKASLDFPLERSLDSSALGPQPLSRLRGRVREGGELLRVFSETGNIRVKKDL
jgi:hypothetical protein